MTTTRKVLIGMGLIVVLTVTYMIGASGARPTARQLQTAIDTHSEAQTPEQSIDSCIADECLADPDITYPVGTLPDAVKTSLDRAYTDEYRAHAFYTAVISRLGQSRPFTMIVRSEQTHMASLQALYDKYGVQIPELSDGEIQVPDTLALACEQGVIAERANIALYEDDLMPTVQSYPDILQVYTRLKDASQDRHLPAFGRCAS